MTMIFPFFLWGQGEGGGGGKVGNLWLSSPGALLGSLWGQGVENTVKAGLVKAEEGRKCFCRDQSR